MIEKQYGPTEERTMEQFFAIRCLYTKCRTSNVATHAIKLVSRIMNIICFSDHTCTHTMQVQLFAVSSRHHIFVLFNKV